MFEALQKDPNAYVLNVPQRQAFEAMQRLNAEFSRLEKKHGFGPVVDDEGVPAGAFQQPDQAATVYHPRVVVQRPAESPGALRRGAAVGATAFFEKPRMFETEAEGWAKGYRYETSIAKRLATRAERLYKRIADKRLASDPDLGGTTRKGLERQPDEAYAEELGSGEMTEAKLQKIADSIEAAGRVWQPAFFGKIFTRETADALNKLFPSRNSVWRQAAASVNNALKGLWLGFDLGVGEIQGQALITYRPDIWARANFNSMQAMFSKDFFPEYVRRNLDVIREMAQFGSSVGRLEEMLAGAERGELLHRIPGVKQTIGRAIEPFARQFQTFIDTAKVELWKAWREVTPPEQRARAMQAIESVLSTSRMEPIGLSATRTLTERVALIAPSYYRGALNLVAAAGERGVSGQITRRALSGYLLGGAVLFYGIGKALGMKDDEILRRFDPRRSDFLLWPVKIGKMTTEIGLGGIYKSLLRLAGNVARVSMEHPDNWLSLAPDKNPITRWYRGHAGPAIGLVWDKFSGRDYLGRDSSLKNLGQTFLPMTVRVLWTPGQQVNYVDLASTFVGLTSFERNNAATQEIQRLASRFNRQAGVYRPSIQVDPSAETYATLFEAVRSRNYDGARKILDKLARTKRPDDIRRAIFGRPERPFTGGTLQQEKQFFLSLNPEQQRLYREARKEQIAEVRMILQLHETPQP